MCYLLIIEVIGVSGFIVAQVTGGVGRVGRLSCLGGGRPRRATASMARSEGSIARTGVRSSCRSGFNYVSWLVGTLEVLVILRSLHVSATAETAVVIEALGTGVRFATFFVPASLGTLEGAYAAAFTAFGWAASDGLAFSLVRRGRQAVWIGIGLAVLGAMGAWRSGARESSGESREVIEAKPVRAD